MKPDDEALRRKLITDLIDEPVWEQGKARIVAHRPWITVEERDLIVDALRLVPFLHRLADRVEAEGDLTGAECLRGLAHDHPRMVRVLDDLTEQSRLSERMANSVAVEHLRMRRRR